MQNRKFKVALIGYGYSGKTLHAPLIESTPDLVLSQVISSSPAKVKADLPKAQVLATPEEAFQNPEIDLIVIATPNDLHFRLAKQALQSGKNVVVDKPFTHTSTEAKELIQLAKSKNLLLSVFHNRRWDADFLTIQKLIRENAFGEILQFESHFDRYRPLAQARWKEQSARGGGVWFDLGSHLVDQALQLFGLPKSIQLDSLVQRVNSSADDYFHANLHYDKLRVILHCTSLAACETPRFIIHGTKGSYVKYGLDTQEEALKNGGFPGIEKFGHDPREGSFSTRTDGIETKKSIVQVRGAYEQYYSKIAEALNGSGQNPVSSESALKVIEVLEKHIF